MFSESPIPLVCISRHYHAGPKGVPRKDLWWGQREASWVSVLTGGEGQGVVGGHQGEFCDS